MRASWTIAFGLGLLATACSGDDFVGPLSPDGFFSPTELRFDVRAIGRIHEEDVDLTNAGNAPLRLAQARFEPALPVFALRDADGNLVQNTLAPGTSAALKVLFSPEAEQAYETNLVVTADTFSVSLPLFGTGRQLDPNFTGPSSVNFSQAVEVGRTVTQTIQLTNSGEAPGRLTPDQVMAPFSLRNSDNSPFTESPEIPPNEGIELIIAFSPTEAGTYDQALTLLDDVQTPIEIRVRAESIQPGQLTCDTMNIDFQDVPRGEDRSQTVLCSVTGGPYRLEALDWEGPAGVGFAVDNIVPAVGSNVESLRFDVRFAPRGLARANPYQGEVVLQAGHGATTRIPVSGRTISPPRDRLDLLITTSWTTDVDVDLHLVRAGGSLFSLESDCHWAAKTIDWNTPDDLSDDPFLDQDATFGPGEEQASIEEARNETYDVYVQYYEFPTSLVSVAPTVTIEVPGQTFGPFTRNLTQCGTMWSVGRIRFDQTPPTFEVDNSDSSAYVDFARCP